MREILFRGLSQSLKDEPLEWVYGSLDISINNRMGYPRIIVHDPELYYGSKYVSMSSIGQFTGLKDKNGVKIFEGDIVNGVCINTSLSHCSVVWNHGCFYFKQIGAEGFIDMVDNQHQTCEVIGNIFQRATARCFMDDRVFPFK